MAPNVSFGVSQLKKQVCINILTEMFLFNINVYLNEEWISSSVLLLWFDIQSTILGQTKLNVYTIE